MKERSVYFLVVIGFLAMIGDEYGLSISMFIIAWFIREYA